MLWLAFVFLILVGTVHGQDYNHETDSDGLTKFGLDLYRAELNSRKNSVVSPFSFRVLFSILYIGAYGDTAELLKTKLYLGDKYQTLATQRASLDRILQYSNLKIANKLYLTENYPLLVSFRTLVGIYKTDIQQINFKETETICDQMNNWVAKKTNGLIKQLVPPNSISSDSILVLLNAIYFKASWKFTFHHTVKAKFTSIDERSNEITFLKHTESYLIANDDQLKSHILELPYAQNTNFVFWIILPKFVKQFHKTADNLDLEAIKRIKTNLQKITIEVQIPEFRIETNINGKEALHRLGLDALLENLNLDILQDSLPLKISELKQEATISVNANGTEGTSTGTFDSFKTSSTQLIPQFIADHPFIFFVFTKDKMEPMFIGHYTNVN